MKKQSLLALLAMVIGFNVSAYDFQSEVYVSDGGEYLAYASAVPGDYYDDYNPFLWLSQRKYSKREFVEEAGWYNTELFRIWRNAMYARHGYIFKSKDLKAYFSQFSWYRPRYKDVSRKLSQIEQHNIRVLKSLEN